jgi:hypothetical protein
VKNVCTRGWETPPHPPIGGTLHLSLINLLNIYETITNPRILY